MPPSETNARWRALIFNLKKYLLFCLFLNQANELDRI
jgi:hypothetical protein